MRDLKRLDEALASYDRALRIKPDYAGALFCRGIALQNLNRLDEALESHGRALRIHARTDAEALNNRANVLRDLKRLDEALQSYDQTLEINPDHAEAINSRGIALHGLQTSRRWLAS